MTQINAEDEPDHTEMENENDFVSVPGIKGKVFVPQESGRILKKNPCKDCFSCQQCGDDRCRVCLGQRGCKCETQSV